MHEYESWYYSYGPAELWKNVKHWIDLANEASNKIGKELNMGPQVKKLMSDAGFVDIGERIVKVRLASQC